MFTFPPIVIAVTAVAVIVPLKLKLAMIEVVPLCNVFVPLPLNVILE